jgi:hypothetical protein
MTLKIIYPVMPILLKKPPKINKKTFVNKNKNKIKFNYNNYSKPLNLSSIRWDCKPQGF